MTYNGIAQKQKQDDDDDDDNDDEFLYSTVCLFAVPSRHRRGPEREFDFSIIIK